MKKIIYSIGFLISTSMSSIYAQALQHSYSKVMGTSGSSETINRITTDALGNSYAVGTFSGTVDFDPGVGTATLTANAGTGFGVNDAFVAKYDANGNYVWAFKIGTGINFDDVVRDICVDNSAGMIYVTGNFSGFNVDFDPSAATANLSGGSQAVFIAKYTTAGVYQSAAQILGNAVGNGIKVFNNTVYITGSNTGTTNFNNAGTTNVTSNSGSSDIYVACYNSLLSLFWAFNVGNNQADIGTSLDVDAGGNVYVTGTFSGVTDFDPSGLTANLTSSGGTDGFIVKYNPSGNYQWAQGFGTAAADGGKKIKIATGAAYIVGNYNGTNQAYLTKRDITNFGVQVFQKPLTGTADVFASEVDVDASGNIYVTGHFNGANQSFDGSGTITFQNNGGFDSYIAKYNSSGVYLYAFTYGGSGNDYTSTINVDASNNVRIGGVFNITANFSSSPVTTHTLTSFNGYDVFMAKYTPCTLPSAPTTANAILCYPTSLTFTASGSGTITWHTTNTGTILATGATYTTINTNPSGVVSTTTLYAQNNDACGSSTKSAIVYTINPKPSVSAFTGISMLCAGATVDIYTYGADSYTLANNGQTIGANTFFSFTPSATTNFTISGTNSYACSSSTMFTQNVSTCTNIDEEISGNRFSIYPNPANDFLNVELKNLNETTTISIINALGEITLTENVISNNITLKTNTLISGIYFIKVESKNSSIIQKLIKQ
jgi:hypothetical protein